MQNIRRLLKFVDDNAVCPECGKTMKIVAGEWNCVNRNCEVIDCRCKNGMLVITRDAVMANVCSGNAVMLEVCS